MRIHWRHRWGPTDSWLEWLKRACWMGYPPSATRFVDQICGCGATRILDSLDGYTFGYRSSRENKRLKDR